MNQELRSERNWRLVYRKAMIYIGNKSFRSTRVPCV